MDLFDDKLRMAEELGATYTVNAQVEDPVKAIRALGGADAAIATAVSPAAFEQAYGSLRRGGRLVFVGLPAENEIRLPIFRDRAQRHLGDRVHRGQPDRSAGGLRAPRAGRTKLWYETRHLAEVNEAIRQVEKGEVTARLVFDLR